jgi:nitrate reductase delta subunit
MQQICALFAELLDYPTTGLSRQARDCAGLVASTCPSAATFLEEFCDVVLDMPLSRLEEIYTRTFDLKCLCYPYVGYHLVGESYRRGAFLARLGEGYRARGFAASRELPDHISVVLRFLALQPEVWYAGPGDEAFDAVLLREGLVPALAKMAACFEEESSNPYALIVRALSMLVSGDGSATG